MAARVFRGVNNEGRHEGYVVDDINRWLEELGNRYFIVGIETIHQGGPHDEELVWVNAAQLDYNNPTRG